MTMTSMLLKAGPITLPVALGTKSAVIDRRELHPPRIVRAPMPHRGTSRNYIVTRLRRTEGLAFLADAIERGEITSHAVAIELGWIARSDLVGVRPSQAKARHFLFQRLVRENARAAQGR